MKILGALIALFFIYVGVMFIAKPRRTIQTLQTRRYGSPGEPKSQQILMTRIFGVIITLIGLYFLGIVVVSFIYPATT